MVMTVSLETEPDSIRDHSPFVEIEQEALMAMYAQSVGMVSLKGKTLVVKLGGSTLEHQRAVLQDIIWLHTLGIHVVLVHGGGPYINEWLKKLNIPTRFQQGLRVTDAQTLDVVRMVLCGHINQELVAMAEQMGGNAVGLCGTDGGMVRAHITDERLGFVGQVDTIDSSLVQNVLDQGYLPIIAPLGLGPDGKCLNINADLVASRFAGELKADKLIFLSDVNGICAADGSLIAELSEAQARQLIDEGVIHGGMIPKVIACLDALVAVPCVQIINGSVSHILLHEVANSQTVGTRVVR